MLARIETTVEPTEASASLRPAERRLHRRFALKLPGRFMRANKQEFECSTINVSVGGVAIATTASVGIGERIVAYFDEIGGLEGTVARVFTGGFALALTVSAHKREKLAAQITWILNSAEFSGAEARRHGRVAASVTTTLTLEDGTTDQVRCLDVSVSGASVATKVRPGLGSNVTLGRLKGKVVRHHGEGIAVQFFSLQKPDSLKRYFG
jgi:hypothetical protein